MTPRKTAKPKAKSHKGGMSDFIEDDNLSLDDKTAIQLASPTAMSGYTDIPNIGAEDVFIPKLRLAQGLTAEVQNGVAKPGQWLMTGDEDAVDTTTIVPLKMNRRRELRDPDENRQIVCRSFDSLAGVGDPGGDCASCPMSKWTQGSKQNSKNSAPKCNFIYSYIVYVVESDNIGILEFSRTSIPGGKMLNTMIMQRGLGTFAAKLSAKSSKGPAGTYYSPVVSGAKGSDKMFAAAKAKVKDVFGS